MERRFRLGGERGSMVPASGAQPGGTTLWSCVALAIGLYLALVSAPLPSDSWLHRSIDDSAFKGQAWMFEHGLLSGRDFQAAYGLVPQLLARGALALRFGEEYGGAAPAVRFVMRGASVSLLVVWSVLLPLERRRSLPLLLVAGFGAGAAFQFSFLRPLAAMLALRASARVLGADRPPSPWDYLAAGVALATLPLISIDYFVYAAASVTSIAALSMASRHYGLGPGRAVARRLGVVGLSALAALLGWLSVASATARSSDEGPLALLYRALELAATYPRTMGLEWGFTPGSSLVCLLLVVGASAAAAIAAARSTRPLGADFLLLFPFVVFAVKGALVRSDRPHLALALLPALLVALLVAAEAELDRRVRCALFGLALAAIALWPGPQLPFRPPVIESFHPLRAWHAIRHAKVDRGVFPDAPIRSAAARKGPLFVFPLQPGYAAMAGRPPVGSVDQVYAAHDIAMQERLVGSLESAGPGLDVLYAIDGPMTWAMDGVQSISRSPIVAKYLLGGFLRCSNPELEGGAFVACRARGRRSWKTLPFEATRQGKEVELAIPATANCPVLELAIRIDYPAWSWLSWPAGVRFRAEGWGSPVETRLLPIEVDEPFVTLVSPLRGERFAELFNAGPPPQVGAPTGLHLEPEDGGPFGAEPKQITITALRCLS